MLQTQLYFNGTRKQESIEMFASPRRAGITT